MSVRNSPLLGLMAIFWPLVGHAEDPEEAFGANTLAMGGTAAANADDNAAITANPGVLGLEKRYDLQGVFSVNWPSVGWGLSLLDAETNKSISVGAVWRRSIADPPLTDADLPGWVQSGTTPSNVRETHDITLALASPFFERRLAFGLSGNVSIVRHERLGTYATGNMDVGAGAKPVPWLTIGLVGRNLLPIVRQSERPASVMLGLRVADAEIGAIATELDVKTEKITGSRFTVGAGAEKNLGIGRFRAGWRYEGPVDRHFATVGLGAQNEFGRVEYGVAVPLNRFEVVQMIHRLSLTIRIRLPKEEDEEEYRDWGVPK